MAKSINKKQIEKVNKTFDSIIKASATGGSKPKKKAAKKK